MKRAALFLFASIPLTCACGITYANQDPNKPLPADFVNRVLYKDTAITKYRLDYLVGGILICSPNATTPTVEDCELALDRILKPQTQPEATAPKTDIYHSKIDQGAAVQGSYLAFAANFSADQVAEVSIADTTLLAVSANDVPVDDIRAYASTHPPRPGQSRYWIEAALLSVIGRQDSTKIKADASGVIGNTAGIKGSVYHMEEFISKDFAIALFRRNIDTRPERSVLPTAIKVQDREGATIKTIRGVERLIPQ